MVDVETVIKINRKFKGHPLNISNLEFDVDMANQSQDPYKKATHLIRGIVSGHPFNDGNKRTAVYVVHTIFKKYQIKCQRKKLVRLIRSIAKNQVTDISVIERKLRKCSMRKMKY